MKKALEYIKTAIAPTRNKNRIDTLFLLAVVLITIYGTLTVFSPLALPSYSTVRVSFHLFGLVRKDHRPDAPSALLFPTPTTF